MGLHGKPEEVEALLPMSQVLDLLVVDPVNLQDWYMMLLA